MLDKYIIEKIELYKDFLQQNTLSATKRLERIDMAVKAISSDFKTPEEYLEVYKGHTFLTDIIFEICDNYLVDSHTQDLLKEKMNMIAKTIHKKRDSL
jgi:hypothetical protein